MSLRPSGLKPILGPLFFLIKSLCDLVSASHGRDNKLHVWTRTVELPLSGRLGGSAALPDLPTPELCYSMDVNALNYCPFSLMELRGTGGDQPPEALIAIPNLVESSEVGMTKVVPSLRLCY